MGFLDTIKAMFQGGDKGKVSGDALKSVKAAAQESNYNLASIRAFYALEEYGTVFTSTPREKSVTAREYSKLLVETGIINGEELEPIIHSFERAQYSEEEVTFDDYRQIEEALENARKKLRGGRSAQPQRTKKGGQTKRRKRSSGTAKSAAAARRRKARKRKA
ncbi:MAG: DUF4129 domain-containing protein [Candidatus Heimdallarchaeota archaeon]|nr:DUF4129 domain-containing protein [Candidatus Heimdallarchaeota archaeon]